MYPCSFYRRHPAHEVVGAWLRGPEGESTVLLGRRAVDEVRHQGPGRFLVELTQVLGVADVDARPGYACHPDELRDQRLALILAVREVAVQP